MNPRKTARLSQWLVLLGQAVGLLIVDHLQPVLDPPKEPVVGGQGVGHRAVGAPGLGQHGQRVDGARGAEPRVASAEDQLLGLGEELDLADAAASELEIVPVDRDHLMPAGIMNPPLYAVNVLDRREVQGPPPYER